MREIILKNGLKTKVDDDDFEKYGKLKWRMDLTNNQYIKTSQYQKDTGKTKTIYLHRLIMKEYIKDGFEIDHINRNRLDNRKSNLRICKRHQNMGNVLKHQDNNSGYKGVCWDKARKKWIARICYKYKTFNLGRFSDIFDAVKVYDKKAKELFGEFAHTNFK
jgi:hypothetical protein